MGRAGCMLIAWGLESGNEAILKRARKGYRLEQAHAALRWAHAAAIKNWGYFIIGLPARRSRRFARRSRLRKRSRWTSPCSTSPPASGHAVLL